MRRAVRAVNPPAPTVALIGNPNTGKSTLFNALTGLRQHVGNYPGVTIERKEGSLELEGRAVCLLDLPGTYSLAARSPDELIAVDVLLGRLPGQPPVDLVVAILDAAALERNLYLLSQLTELPVRLIVALNMIDVAADAGVTVDAAVLSERLGLPVVPIRADRETGLDALRRVIAETLQQPPGPRPRAALPEALSRQSDELAASLGLAPAEALRALVDRDGAMEGRLRARLGESSIGRLEEARRLAGNDRPPAAAEALARYAWIRERLEGCVRRPELPVRTHTDRIDAVLTHKLWGTLVLLATLALVFESIFVGAQPLMDGIKALQAVLAGWVGPHVPEGAWRSFVTDGLIGGVGSVVVFLPQILLLFFFIVILEDCGYMARAAFLMDRLFARVGLSGRSMIPLLSSFACAIPGIMSARTISDPRQRLATILVSPLMSCSARLPIYVILIGAFVPAKLRGLTLLGMYLVGVVTAVGVLAVLGKTLLRGAPTVFVLELPPYRRPSARTVALRLWDRGRSFLTRAGTIILAVAMAVWALTYFPRPPEIHARYEAQRAAAPDQAARLDREEAGEYVRQSWLGRMGLAIEPVVRPLGWDWKLGMAALASFPAREVIVATLGTIYNLGGDQEEDSPDLQGVLRADYSLATALSVMVFFALCAQCASTLVVMRRETGSWLWPAVAFGYMTGLAYVGALATYQIAAALGA